MFERNPVLGSIDASLIKDLIDFTSELDNTNIYRADLFLVRNEVQLWFLGFLKGSC